MATIKQLADKLAKAEDEVRRLREEIAQRAGEVDPVSATSTASKARQTATKKAAG